MTAEHWAVVGGGVLGLTLAHRLAQAGRRVTVIEAGDRLGGLADSWEIGEIQWDRHYHVTLLSDLALRGLLAELGLEDALRWSTTRTDFYTDGRFHPLNNAVDFLRFPPLGLVEKARLAATILYASSLRDGRRLEREPLEGWLRSLSGDGAFGKIWLPLLRAKLGENYRLASAAFIWAVIQRLYAARRSGLKTEMFGYIEGGYGRVFERFAEVLAGEGVSCALRSPVEAVMHRQDGLSLRVSGEELRFDRVVVTTPSHLAARLCPDLTAAEREALERAVYQGIICPSVLLKRPLRGCYLTYIADPIIPFTAVIEMSALVERMMFRGHTLVYLPRYVTADDPLFEVPDETIEARFLDALQRMYPGLSRDDVLAFRISRVRHVLAVATLNYSDGLLPYETSVPGLFIVNSSHIVNGTLNVNETVTLAEHAARTLIALPPRAACARALAEAVP